MIHAVMHRTLGVRNPPTAIDEPSHSNPTRAAVIHDQPLGIPRVTAIPGPNHTWREFLGGPWSDRRRCAALSAASIVEEC